MTTYYQPDFIDNREQAGVQNTLHQALIEYIGHKASQVKIPPSLDISTGYFNPEGYALLADVLDKTSGVRLLLGADPDDRAQITYLTLPGPGDPESKRARLARRLTEEKLQGLEDDMAAERDRAEFSPTGERELAFLMRHLDEKRRDDPLRPFLEVRKFAKQFLHAKAFILRGDGVVAGSSNFTRAGLTTNLELNLGRYDPPVRQRVDAWFESLWSESEPFDLGALYRARFETALPYHVYLKVLLTLFGEDDGEELDRAKYLLDVELSQFQRDGLSRARRIIRKHGGVIIADGVGLGKTYIAGKHIVDAIKGDGRRALIIAPASLRDKNWEDFKFDYGVSPLVISFNELSRYRELMEQRRDFLRPDEMSLIVIDEAHHLRSMGTKAATELHWLLTNAPRNREVMLLTATPVNNTLWDLYNLLSYFIPQDNKLLDAQFGSGILSLKDLFNRAELTDPENLDPEMLFPVLEETVVRRSRHFVKTHYSTDTLPIKDRSTGKMVRVTIDFPKPHVSPLHYTFNGWIPDGYFGLVEESIVGRVEVRENGIEHETLPTLKLARYSPNRYAKDPQRQTEALEANLIGLIRMGMLKRLESSVESYRRTLSRMRKANDSFLALLGAGWVALTDALYAMDHAARAREALEESGLGEDEDLALRLAAMEPKRRERLVKELKEDESLFPAAGFDVASMQEDILHDNAVLDELLKPITGLDRDRDPKLLELERCLANIARMAEQDGNGDTQKRNNRKTVIFSEFVDTARMVADWLVSRSDSKGPLAAYRGRIELVVGGDEVHEQRVVSSFAPETAGKRDAQDLYDVIVTTDVLAEGQNLQQARNVVNYDLPWNPMRIVQRHGRIDRIGSKHADVYMHCMFPERELDRFLRLEARLRRKIKKAEASVGVEGGQVIPGQFVTDRTFAETPEEAERRRQIEALEVGDATILEKGSGPDSGEELRLALKGALLAHGEVVRGLPWAVGSGFAKGPQAGFFFCAVAEHGSLRRTYVRFLPTDGTGSLLGVPPIREALTCLRRIRCDENTPAFLHEDARERAQIAWAIARADIHQEWHRLRDPAALQQPVDKIFRDAANVLRAIRPADMTDEQANVLVAGLEQPWHDRYKRMFRDLMARHRNRKPTIEAAEEIAKLSLDLRMNQPIETPPRLPAIGEHQIHLVAWMEVVAD